LFSSKLDKAETHFFLFSFKLNKGETHFFFYEKKKRFLNSKKNTPRGLLQSRPLGTPPKPLG